MGVKQLIYLIVFLVSLTMLSAIPVPDYTLYGSAIVSGKTLTKEDTNVISIKLNEQDLVKFTMGDVAADAYVLRVPMNSERTDNYAMAGDTVRIYIDGKEIDQSPVTIGDFGSTVKLDITVSGTPSTAPEPTLPRTSGGSSSSKITPKITETIVVSEDKPEPSTTKTEPVKKTVIINEQKEPVAQQTSTEEQEEKVSLLQKIKDLLGFGVPITGEAVADVPTPRPLVGILIALMIVAFGLLVAYVIIFKLS